MREAVTPEIVHPIYRVVSFEIIAPYTLWVEFDDGTSQTIDFEPVLAGELYGPLRNLGLFNQVEIDPEAQTLVWPNGADFDPATLHTVLLRFHARSEWLLSSRRNGS